MKTFIFFFDAEGDVVLKNGRDPWQFSALMVTPDFEPVFSLNTLIAEGLGQYTSRQRDQDKLVKTGLPVISFTDVRNITQETINAIIADGSRVVVMAWGSRDFPKLGGEFFPSGVEYANGIETWADDCPLDYSAPLTKKGKIGTTLKNVYDFEIGETFAWHDAEADVIALSAIMRKSLERGATIASYPNADSFHRNPSQLAWNRLN